MKISLIIALIVILAALQVPALAIWNIEGADPGAPPVSVVEATVPATAQDAPVWTAKVQGLPAAADAKITMVTVRSDDRMGAFIRSAKEMRVLNTCINRGPFAQTNNMVPEPSSIAGLTAGLGGLFFQLRRLRKRS